MGRAKVVAPPPKDYIPEPLVAPPLEITIEEIIIEDWKESSLIEETIDEGPSPEELEKERIAQEKHQELQRLRIKEQNRIQRIAKKAAKKDPELLEEMKILRAENEKLAQERDAAEKAREETIVALRNKATEQKGNQLNLVTQRKPTIWSRLKAFFRRKRIDLATVAKSNYEVAIIQRARVAVPKMLDDIERMHEQLTILEELIAKYVERQKIKD